MAGAILTRHVRRRRASFVLTSLIDVIFLLVIFFMVSSQIVPFSMIGVGPVASGGDEMVAPADSAPSTAPVALRIAAGRVTIGGERVEMGGLAPALEGLKAQGVTGVILISTATATVQDVVSVLEAVKAAAISDVTILNRGVRP